MEIELLKDIVIIFALSTLVNFIFTRFRIPTAVGYLMTGIIAGPHLLSLVNDKHGIELLAEIGVVLLLFTIGMEFSLKHLIKIRRIVFFGGFIQVFLTAGAFFFVSKFYGLSLQAGIFIGFLAALSSSALVLKLLQERSELTSNYGRTILGILIFQDILLVPLLLFTNILGNSNVNLSNEILLLVAKATLILAIVYIGNRWILPKLMQHIAFTKNQELFMMSIFLICLAVALLTSHMGMSLAFGAFLAGLMISESPYSHNAFSNLIPFKDTFTSFFFVSIGMLLDVNFIIENYGLVLFTVVLLIGVKSFIAGATGFLLGHTFRGTILVGLALGQVGEFSFVLAKIGLSNNIISSFYYQLFLAVAVITMALTPFLIKGSLPLANLLLKLPIPKFLVTGLFPLKEIDIPNFSNHLVIIGKDSTAQKLSIMAKMNDIEHVSIMFDPLLVKEKMQKGDIVVYGDAVNEPILLKAHVDQADVVIVSVGSVIPSMAIIERVRHINKHAYIIARTKLIANLPELYKLGADQVIAEKLEIAIDLFNRVLIKKLYTQKDVNQILSHIRSLNLGEFSDKDLVKQQKLLAEHPDFNISAITIEKGSSTVGRTLRDIELRSMTGVTLLAIKRNAKIMEHPSPQIKFDIDDIVYVLGNPEQVNRAFELFSADN